MASELSQQFEALSKKMAENEVQIKEVERQLKRIRDESVAAAEDDDHQHHHHNHHHHHPNQPTTSKTTGGQQETGNGSKDKSRPLFKVLFVKCPLESCLEFALTVKGIKEHLFSEHGIIPGNRCLATERCVRQQVHFRTRRLLMMHIKEEHLNADGLNHFHCYKCGPRSLVTFTLYKRLEQHFHYHHEEGHFVCTRCKGRRDPSTGCQQYAFSAKYSGEVVQHWKEVHNQNGRKEVRLMPPIRPHRHRHR